MAKNRIVNTRFWIDDYIAKLDPVEKLLFLYFLTNPSTDISGVYELPLKNIALDTGIDADMVKRIIKRFSESKKIFYIKGWVGIKNFIKHQSMNPKVEAGIKNGLTKAPKELVDRLSIDYDSLSHSNTNTNINTNSNSNVSDSKPLAESKPFEEIDAELSRALRDTIKQNLPTFKEPNLNSWAVEVNKMRRLDGRTPEQIKFIIAWCQKDPFWQGNILSAGKLRKQFDTLVAQVKRGTLKQQSKALKIGSISNP